MGSIHEVKKCLKILWHFKGIVSRDFPGLQIILRAQVLSASRRWRFSFSSITFVPGNFLYWSIHNSSQSGCSTMIAGKNSTIRTVFSLKSPASEIVRKSFPTGGSEMSGKCYSYRERKLFLQPIRTWSLVQCQYSEIADFIYISIVSVK